MLIKPGPEQLDYVLIPGDWLAEVGVAAKPEPGDIRHPTLRDAHYELDGLDVAGVCEKLAVKFKDLGGIAKRLNPKTVTALAKVELETDANELS
jgi:hypothetical protein